MSKTTESISAINSLLRTMLGFCVLAAACLVGGFLYSKFRAPERELAEKQAELDAAQKKLEVAEALLVEKELEIDHLETTKRLLKVDHRIADLEVLEQSQQGEGENAKVMSKVSMTELDDEGNPLAKPKVFEIEGDKIYIEYNVVKFEDRYIEEADLERGTSICIFQRIYGEHQKPIDGFVLDQVGVRPTIYGRGNTMSEFEKKIWDDFWSIANDPKREKELGIRAANSEAPGIIVKPGAKYRIMLRASDGLSLKPVENEPDPNKPGA